MKKLVFIIVGIIFSVSHLQAQKENTDSLALEKLNTEITVDKNFDRDSKEIKKGAEKQVEELKEE